MSTGTEMVQKDGEPVVRGRIRPALDAAIRLLEEEGYTIADAAQAVGYKTHSLTQALRKPHVRAHRAHVKRAWREGETAAAWITMTKLARKAMSEDVQFKSAKFLIEQDEASRTRMPEQARQAVQIIAQHLHFNEQPLPQRTPGVFEALPMQAIEHHPSNSEPVGRGDSDEDED